MHPKTHRRRLTLAVAAAILLLVPAPGWASLTSTGAGVPEADASPAWVRAAAWLPAWMLDLARLLELAPPTGTARPAPAASRSVPGGPGAGPGACESEVCSEAGPDLDPDG